MKKIAVFNQKGGVGKTTLTANLSSYLTEYHHQKVLVVDGDPQGSVTKYMLGTVLEDNPDLIQHTMKDVFENPDADLDDFNLVYEVGFEKRVRGKDRVDKKGNIHKTFEKKEITLYVVPNEQDTATVPIDDNMILDKLLKHLEEKYDFDICLIDCPPSICSTTLNTLSTADYLLVPVNTDVDSFEGLGQVFKTYDTVRSNGTNVNLEILGVVVTKIDDRLSVDQLLMEAIKESAGNLLLKTFLRERKGAYKKERLFCTPLNITQIDEKASKEMRALTKEIYNRIKNN